MIFISGVHGVGKSFFCSIVHEKLGINTYQASTLISEMRHSGFDGNKLTSAIDDNQRYLLSAVQELQKTERHFILDGHFCLLDKIGKVTRIPLGTFTSIKPEVIILLTESPEVISKRRKERDNVIELPEKIAEFQHEEEKYAREVALLIGARLFVSRGSGDLNDAIDFIRTFREVH